MNINVEVIHHSRQRYPTVGDWWWDDQGTLQIRVSRMGNHFFESLVAFHEQWEALLCLRRRISEAKVTEFDKHFENLRDAGHFGPLAEPGDELNAPYRREHCSATGIERIMCAELDFPWKEYESAIEDACIIEYEEDQRKQGI